MDEPPIVTHRIAGRTLAFECPTELARRRAELLFDKEPGTIAWIDGFRPGEVLWDIGANVGTYALYAAVARDCTVWAFEPGAANFHGLNCNILRNGLDARVRALPLALDERCRIDTLRMRDNRVGGSLHVFGSAVDFKRETFVPAWQQGALALSIDALREQYGLPAPQHVKIDVDGLETAVVRGGARTFAAPELRSVLVEVDLDDADEVAEIGRVLSAAGLQRDDGVPGNAPRLVKGTRILNLIHRRAAH